MLIISGNITDTETIAASLNQDEVKLKILDTMHNSTNSYQYSSNEELLFVLDMRKNIVNAAKVLFRSRIRFKTFNESECNEQFWRRTEEGGFLLRDDVKPSAAINDIFERGWVYGTECATAIVIIFYKAVLDTFGENLFNSLSSGIYLMDWQNLDGYLAVINYRNPPNYFPGDCRYFKNPDVDPLTPEWQGENVIDLGNSYYYGHGLGISMSDNIIYALNTHRKQGSDTSAFLLDSCTIPDFNHLFYLYSQNSQNTSI